MRFNGLAKTFGCHRRDTICFGDPIKINEISKAFNITDEQVLKYVEQLQHDYNRPCRGLMISKVGRRIRMTTKPDIFPYIEAVFKPK